MYKICIDPGHGGTDPGAVNGAAYEKDIVLDVALKLKKLLLKYSMAISILSTIPIARAVVIKPGIVFLSK